MGIVAVLTIAALAASVVPVPARGTPASSVRSVPQRDFSPVVIASLVPPVVPVPTGPPTTAPTIAPRVPQPTVSPTPAATRVIAPRPTPRPSPVIVRGHRAVDGLASWYCSPAAPTCVPGYSPGSMVAAACARLRVAMGSEWRGRVVEVSYATRHVTVTLVDECASTSKLIDLYWHPMSLLGGTGVLQVTVRW